MNSLLRVLFISEEQKYVEPIINTLHSGEFISEYSFAKNPKEMLNMLKSDDYDIVVAFMDTDFNAYSALELLKKQNLDIPLFAFGTEENPNEIHAVMKSGAVDYFRIDMLARLVPAVQREIKDAAIRKESVKIFTDLQALDFEFKKITGTSKFANINDDIEHIFEPIANDKSVDGLDLMNTILENIPNMIYVKDVKDLTFKYINKAGEKLTGFNRDELIGKNVFELFIKDFADHYHSKDLELLQDKKPIEISEEMVLTKDNKLKIFYTKKLLIEDHEGNPKFLLGISEDLTEYIKAQAELRKSEMRFAKIFHASPVAIFIIRNNDKKIIDANSKFLELMKYTREEFVDRNVNSLNIFNNEVQKIILINEASAFSHGEPKEIEFLTSEGKVITLLTSIEQMHFDKESWIIYIGVDISERKKATLEIESALEKQKELNSLKTQFISMISHEFRTPLTTIMLSTDLLKRYGDSWNPDEKSRHFQRIQDTILKMTQLMENVLIIGRIDSGKFQFNPEPMDLQGFCFSIAKNLEFSQNGTHKINIQFNGNNEEAHVDENLLGLVLNNLLSNAIKYSPNGSVVDFIVNCNNVSAELIVKDRGIGIPEEELNLLFQSFFRASNVGSIAGYGLGLSIVKKCVDTHRGKIDVRSVVGKGTTFIVSIPINITKNEAIALAAIQS